MVVTNYQMEKLDQQLLEKQKAEYDAELALFAISEEARGKGIGKSLYQQAIEYMRKDKLESFYIFTDDYCNYGFYEHMGLKRKGESRKRYGKGSSSFEMTSLIYDNL